MQGECLSFRAARAVRKPNAKIKAKLTIYGIEVIIRNVRENEGRIAEAAANRRITKITAEPDRGDHSDHRWIARIAETTQ
jgi:hypothetical protein